MTAPALFSVVPFTNIESIEEPENGPYFVCTQKGYYLVDRNHWGRYFTPIKEIGTLEEAQPMLWYDIPKLPSTIIGQAYSFFKAIYEAKKSEAMVDITWSEEKGYRLFVPPQRASAGGVKCERNSEHYKGQMVGTIHSHCNFSAFHSGTDTHDADGHDGLHITIGDVLKPTPSIAIMISKNGTRWDKIKLEEVQDGPIELIDHPKWWEKFVNEPEKHNQGKHISNWQPNKPVVMQPQDDKAKSGKGAIVVVGGTAGRSGGNRPAASTTRTGTAAPKDDTYEDIIDLMMAMKIHTPNLLRLGSGITDEFELVKDTLYRYGIEMEVKFFESPDLKVLTAEEHRLLEQEDEDFAAWREWIN